MLIKLERETGVGYQKFNRNELDHSKYMSKTELRKLGYSTKGVEPRGEYWAGLKWVAVYHIDDCSKIKKREIDQEKQKLALEKREITMLENRTCDSCRTEYEKKLEKNQDGQKICSSCQYKIERAIELSKRRFHTSFVKGIRYREESGILAGELIDDKKSGEEIILTLEREPLNTYDPDAVKVIYKGKFLGYVDACLAKVISPVLLKNPNRVLVRIDDSSDIEIRENYLGEQYDFYAISIDIEIIPEFDQIEFEL